MLEESNMKSLASIFLHWHFGGANFELFFFLKENDFPSTYRLSETIPLLGTLDRKYNQPMLVYPAKKKKQMLVYRTMSTEMDLDWFLRRARQKPRLGF